jgi:hypothetical protein
LEKLDLTEKVLKKNRKHRHRCVADITTRKVP